MDTNLVELIVQLSKAKESTSGSPITSFMIASMFVAAVAPTLASIAAYFKAKSAEKNTADAKHTALETAKSVEAVHIAVNSERTKMLQEVKELRDEILEISKQKATLEEQSKSK